MQSQPTESPTTTARNLPWPILIVGILLILGTAALAARLIWEMTSLTWQFGPQMIGFSLAHGYGAPLLLFPLGLALWLLTGALFVIVWRIKRRKVARRSWLTLAAGVFILGVLFIPQQVWNRIFITKLASSPKASEFLADSAAQGDLATVKGLLQRGIPINATSNDGSTALGLAAATGKTDVVKFLVSQGADINATSLYGDSPLQRAIQNHNQTVVDFLTAKGAVGLKGDEAQRERAAEMIVHRDMEEMDRRRKAGKSGD